MPEKLDPQLDELRRRSRRRLIGAIVLALAAAVLVPILLESDPKPLGEDVSVKIPPVDEGKFVNKLGDRTKTATPSKPAATPTDASSAAAPAKDAAPKDATSKDAPPKETAPAKEATARDAIAKDTTAKDVTAKSVTPPAPTTGPVPDGAPTIAAKPATPDASAAIPPKDAALAKPGDAGSSSAAPKPPESVPAADKAAKTATVDVSRGASATKAGSYSVQLAAFSDDKGANALAGRLKKAGHPAYTEPYATSRGTLYRVRVGPYATREAAEAARAKLKADGQNGIIAAAN